MKLLCMLRGHRAGSATIYNGGYHFSRCGCGADIIRSGRSWRTVPRGHRVVWKSGPASHSLEPDLGTHLPVLHREPGMWRVPAGVLLQQRALVLADRTPGQIQAGRREEQEEDSTAASVFYVALALGLQMLFALRPR